MASSALPTFENEPVIHIATTTDLDRVIKGEKFVRYARISLALRLPLLAILEMADTVFNTAAERLGAQVVPHTWGLAPYFQHMASYHHMHPSLPSGKLLAAEVDFIPDLAPIGKIEGNAINAELDGLKVSTRHGTFYWNDGACNNFGTSPLGLHLVDIEPLITPV